MPIRRTSFRSVEAPASATDGQYRRLLRMRVCVCVCVCRWLVYSSNVRSLHASSRGRPHNDAGRRPVATSIVNSVQRGARRPLHHH